MLTIDAINDEMERIVEQLIREYRPEKIILFGSLAKGEFNEGTDIDLFIIKKDVPSLGVDRIRQLDSLIKYRLATDFIVYRPEEVEERLRLGDPFIKSILTEGRVLYHAE
jgi:predicted nucleotidyltransferase